MCARFLLAFLCVCGRSAKIKDSLGWICRADVAGELKGFVPGAHLTL